MPVSGPKPPSSVNTAAMPSPRSSLPRRPNLDGRLPVRVDSFVLALPAASLWSVCAIAMSTIPYSVTWVCALTPVLHIALAHAAASTVAWRPP